MTTNTTSCKITVAQWVDKHGSDPIVGAKTCHLWLEKIRGSREWYHMRISDTAKEEQVLKPMFTEHVPVDDVVHQFAQKFGASDRERADIIRKWQERQKSELESEAALMKSGIHDLGTKAVAFVMAQ